MQNGSAPCSRMQNPSLYIATVFTNMDGLPAVTLIPVSPRLNTWSNTLRAMPRSDIVAIRLIVNEIGWMPEPFDRFH